MRLSIWYDEQIGICGSSFDTPTICIAYCTKHDVWGYRIAADCGTDFRSSILSGDKRFISTVQGRTLLWDAPSLHSGGTGALSPEIKQPGREAGLSPPSSSEAENAEALSPSPDSLRGVVLNGLSVGTNLALLNVHIAPGLRFKTLPLKFPKCCSS
jgi:hypothetical protein